MTPFELSGERGQALGFISREYERIMCKTLSTTIIEDIKNYYGCGFEPETIIRAVEITAKKRADWRYTKAILKNLQEENIFCIKVWDDRQKFKIAMRNLKQQFPNKSESDLFSFAVIAAYRQEIEDINTEISANKSKTFEIDDYVDKD